MKIAIRAGHNNLAPGFSLLLDEIIESRRIKDATVNFLTDFGFEVLDITPENLNPYDDDHIPVEQANQWISDLYLSIHFNRNKAPLGVTDYEKYEGSLGSIVWIYQMGSEANILGSEVLSKLQELGFTNRGIKTKRFYELKGTKMPSLRVEICFVEATEDVALYNKIGIEKIALALATAIKEYFQ